jgi:hypothetical protein
MHVLTRMAAHCELQRLQGLFTAAIGANHYDTQHPLT